jgi:hypothetical protein
MNLRNNRFPFTQKSACFLKLLSSAKIAFFLWNIYFPYFVGVKVRIFTLKLKLIQYFCTRH